MFHFYKKKFGVGKKKAVILLSGWHSTQIHYWLFSKLLEKNGYYCLTYTYDKEILDPNPKLTAKNISLVVADILKEITSLKEQGVVDITIFGTSLGTVPTIIAANSTDFVNSVILNTSGFDIAKTVWSWDNVIKGFKEKMILNGVTLEKLDQEWKRINPKNNLAQLKNKKILLLSSKIDKIIPYEQAHDLQKSLRKINNSIVFKTTEHFGHFFYGSINLFKATTYLNSFVTF